MDFDEIEIHLHFEIDFVLIDPHSIKSKIKHLLKKENIEKGLYQITFLSDDDLLLINQEYLNHDTYTDIITLDYSIGDQPICDIFISVDRVIENAHSQNVSWQEEMDRVIAHGLLHFVGYNDKTEEEKKRMRQKEEEYLSDFKKFS
ncbi:MAG: rRNA maturation RNase YbeY [Bacteroidetes bacterium]|jgi:rRNA maturation RNase YbeY|nr:rRNA maturation RNase YbeY [Bacteroidota bacterium]